QRQSQLQPLAGRVEVHRPSHPDTGAAGPLLALHDATPAEAEPAGREPAQLMDRAPDRLAEGGAGSDQVGLENQAAPAVVVEALFEPRLADPERLLQHRDRLALAAQPQPVVVRLRAPGDYVGRIAAVDVPFDHRSAEGRSEVDVL